MPTPSGKQKQKKNPGPDDRTRRRALGPGRGSLPATRLPLPDVGAARSQRPRTPPPSHPQERRLFRRCPSRRRSLLLPPREWEVQRRELLDVYEAAGLQAPPRSTHGGDRRQRQISPRRPPQGLARKPRQHLRP